MNKIFLFGLLVAFRIMAELSGLPERINFNREWKLQLGDVTGADATIFDTSLRVEVPPKSMNTVVTH
jgi:hypothetical protein